jgi:hypothetical protein
MPGRDDVQLTNRVVDTPVVTAAIITAPADTGPPPVAAPPAGSQATGCTCEDFRRNRVCDHVLMAAAVRMVRRMIDIHADPKQPH